MEKYDITVDRKIQGCTEDTHCARIYADRRSDGNGLAVLNLKWTVMCM